MAEGDNLLKELLEVFRGEAQDHLAALGLLLVELERAQGEGQKPLVESLFRRLHTLKGAAHAVNLIEVAQGCQELEGLMAAIKRGELELARPLFDRLHAGLDEIGALIYGSCPPAADAEHPVASPSAQASPAPAASAPQAPTAAEQEGRGEGTALPVAELRQPFARINQERSTAGETVRVSTRLLESLLLQAEELSSARLAASTLVEDAQEVAAGLSGREADRYQTLDLARETLRSCHRDSREARLARLLEQWCRRERELSGRLSQLAKAGERHVWSLSAQIDPLLGDLKKLHLLPFSSLTAPLAKLVRDLGSELGKDAELFSTGSEIEADRRILAELKEPLIHIIRNVMDHGIEPAAERLLKGKPATGTISLDIRLLNANRVELTVKDDGRGIDPALVKGSALRLELITPEAAERLSDEEALQFIFESGISTSPLITSLSGRGIGLAIVRESLEKLSGHVTVASQSGAGTAFTLSFPLSFAMIEGLLVETAGRHCIIPAVNVEATARVAADEVRSVENRDTVLLGGDVLSLVSLSRLLELGERSAEVSVQQLVLLSAAGKRIAFAVDEVVGVQEVLVKPLGSQLSRVRNVAGATVLGNGRVVPILNVGDLFRSALLSGGSAALRPSEPRPRRRSVLVAEDSITSRTLLKNILEGSGFIVATAVDGQDALARLKADSFDVVVSDVEMPRMDGFELTAAIRKEPRWQGLPVVLVTGLESRADRERGIEVGANAYLVKSSFDQSALVEVIDKLT